MASLNSLSLDENKNFSLAIEVDNDRVNLITNGSFESGPASGIYFPLNPGSTAITGWVVTRGQIDSHETAWISADGIRSVGLNGSPGVGGIAQNSNTVVGQTYRVNFALAGDLYGGNAIKKMAVSAAGQSTNFSFDTTGYSTSNMGWQEKTWIFTATASTSTLEFYSLSNESANNYNGPALDNVSVVALSDTKPVITLTLNPTSVLENGTTNLVYTFTRTGTLTNPLTVNYTIAGTAINGTDYGTIGTSVTFAVNSATATVTVDPTPDTNVELDKTVALTLASNSNYAIGTAGAITGVITNDDIEPSILSFSSPQFSVREDGTSIAAVTVIRTGGSENNVSAKLNLSNGTATEPSDYDNAFITVNFASGELSKTVTIPIVSDNNPEPDETIILTLTNPTGNATIGQQNSAILTILDKDGPIITGFPQGSTGSNKGQTTIIIVGQNFSPTDRISLIAPNGTAKAASKVYWVSETEAWATFNLQGLTTGKYDVKVANGQNSAISNDVFTVTDGVLGNVQVQLSYPAWGVVTVTYTNVGQTDVTAPLLRLNPTNAQVVPLTGTISNLNSNLSQLLNLGFGTSDNGPAGILAPGESGQFSFNYTPKGNGLISFTIEQVKPDDVIDWGSIKAQSRDDYSFIDTAGWDALWSNLTASLGQTYGQFQAVMAENANYLSQLRQETNNLNRLFAFEWKQAANILTNVNLLNTTDVVDAAPGLSLTFNRTFYQSIAERYNLGTLGRGWASQWDLRATTDGNGDVIIRSVGDLQRVFEKQTNGTYTEDGGATLTIVSRQYRLKEANGIVSLFGSDGKLNYVEDTNSNRITLQYIYQ